MSGCPHHQGAVRPELEALPERMRSLPLDHRGYPVPWFVAWIEGKPEFRAMDADKFRRAIREKRCWVSRQRAWQIGMRAISKMRAAFGEDPRR